MDTYCLNRLRAAGGSIVVREGFQSEYPLCPGHRHDAGFRSALRRLIRRCYLVGVQSVDGGNACVGAVFSDGEPSKSNMSSSVFACWSRRVK